MEGKNRCKSLLLSRIQSVLLMVPFSRWKNLDSKKASISSGFSRGLLQLYKLCSHVRSGWILIQLFNSLAKLSTTVLPFLSFHTSEDNNHLFPRTVWGFFWDNVYNWRQSLRQRLVYSHFYGGVQSRKSCVGVKGQRGREGRGQTCQSASSGEQQLASRYNKAYLSALQGAWPNLSRSWPRRLHNVSHKKSSAFPACLSAVCSMMGWSDELLQEHGHQEISQNLTAQWQPEVPEQERGGPCSVNWGSGRSWVTWGIANSCCNWTSLLSRWNTATAWSCQTAATSLLPTTNKMFHLQSPRMQLLLGPLGHEQKTTVAQI